MRFLFFGIGTGLSCQKDTLYPELEFVELTPQNSTGIITMRASIHNQHDKLVFEGTHRYLIRKRPT